MAVAAVLVCLKLWAWLATGALTVAASLADSAVDLAVSVGAVASLVYAARPADAEHRFGHSAIEDLFALGQAVLVAGSGLLIAWGALVRLGEPVALAATGPGLAVMVVSIALTAALVTWQAHVARRTGSRIVAADRLHYLSDLLPALAAIAALGAARVWGVSWPDTALGLAAAAMLLAGAFRIGCAAVNALMDREAEAETVETIRAIAGDHEGLVGFHDLRTRRSGRRLFVQIHAEIDGSRSLEDAHAIGARLRRRIMEALPGADVIVHKDPVRPPR